MSTTNSDRNNSWPWPPERWQRRLAGIGKIILETDKFAEQLLKASENAQLPAEYRGYISSNIQKDIKKNHIQTCKELLEELGLFVPHIYDALKKRFAAEANQADEPIAYTENFVMRTLLDKLSTDINIIQQAIQQRQLNDRFISHQGYILQVADVLAARAMQPAVEKGLIETNVTLLTYLRNRVDIRLIPYEDVILLSIPYGAMNSTCNWLAMDYLALPHEIGHYLYWWGLVDDQPHPDGQEALMGDMPVQAGAKIQIRDGLARHLTDKIKQTEWMTDWLEEIFADTYGCIIAGPVNVLSFQEMLANSPAPVAAVNNQHDHKHPFPALRPLIQTRILRLMSEVNLQLDYANIAEMLDQNWIDWSQKQWNIEPRMNTYQVAADQPGLQGAKIIEDLTPMLRAMLTVLKAVVPANESSSWSGVIREQTSLTELYNNFAFGAFLGSPGEADLPDEMSQVSDNDTELPRARRLREKHIRDVSRFNEWLEAQFAGWSTEGPEAGNTGL